MYSLSDGNAVKTFRLLGPFKRTGYLSCWEGGLVEAS